MTPPVNERSAEYAKTRSRSVRGTGDEEIQKSVESALFEAWITGHSAALESEAVRGLVELLESLNVQAIINGQVGQTNVTNRIHAALKAFRDRGVSK